MTMKGEQKIPTRSAARSIDEAGFQSFSLEEEKIREGMRDETTKKSLW